MVHITIDGKSLTVPHNSTILEAVRTAGVRIPTLCNHPELRPEGNCRLCLVEVEGARSLAASCVYPVSDGMVIHTNTAAIRAARRMVVELLLANHPQDCLYCPRNLNCELQNIAAELGVRRVRFEGEKKHFELDDSNPCLVRDQNKCILCGRCVRVCSERQGVNVYSFANRGFNTTVVPAFNQGLDKVACTYCGQCASVCPTGAIVVKDDTGNVWQALSDKAKHVVIQTAPAVRVALGEALGLEPGTIVTGKMVSALRRLGFDKVFDTNFSADLTIMEEGTEFLRRLQNNGKLPMITSCSPGWVNFAEMFYPDLLEHLSTAKSPQQMFGALVKTYYAEHAGLNPANIISVSVMPCTAKKAEAGREEMCSSGYRDVDFVLTTTELAAMIKEACIDFDMLEEEDYDAPMGIATGAGVIFGATGGVMESALRTVSELITGQELECIDFKNVRGLEGIKEAVLDVGGQELRVAVAHTLANARRLMDKIRSGSKDYHFIEIMACPGGCIGGGGQPISNVADFRKKRIDGLYNCDNKYTIRKSHENPAIRELYNTWLGEPSGQRAHQLLHTSYKKQER